MVPGRSAAHLATEWRFAGGRQVPGGPVRPSKTGRALEGTGWAVQSLRVRWAVLAGSGRHTRVHRRGPQPRPLKSQTCPGTWRRLKVHVHARGDSSAWRGPGESGRSRRHSRPGAGLPAAEAEWETEGAGQAHGGQADMHVRWPRVAGERGQWGLRPSGDHTPVRVGGLLSPQPWPCENTGYPLFQGCLISVLLTHKNLFAHLRTGSE